MNVQNLDDLSCNLSEYNGNFMSMSIVPLVLFHKDKPKIKLKVYGMLDNCSQRIFIRNDVLEFLDTSVVQTTITVRAMLGSSTGKFCTIEGLKVRSINGTTTADLPKEYSQQWIKMKFQPKSVSNNGLTCMRLLRI